MTLTSAYGHRRSIRLRGYDYARPGAYFVTICTRDRACLLGDVIDGEMRLNQAGRIIQTTWNALPIYSANAAFDAFVIMPNHVHGVIVIANADDPDSTDPSIAVGAQFIAPSPCPDISRVAFPAFHGVVPWQNDDTARQKGAMNRAPTLGNIVRGFKARTARHLRCDLGIDHIWQRNYYEQIIRDADALNRIRQYIADNPRRWMFDCENPSRCEEIPPDPLLMPDGRAR